MVYQIVFNLLFILIFKRKKLPEAIEQLDDDLTKKFTREEADRLTAGINKLLSNKLIAALLQRFLNKAVPLDERINLDPDEIKARHERLLPTSANRQQWHNWTESQVAEPLQYLFPGNSPYKDLLQHKAQLQADDYSTLKTLRDIIANAENKNLRVRCVASGHALSDIAVTTDILVNTRRLTQVQRRANHNWIKADLRDGFASSLHINGNDYPEKHYLYETGAGTSVKDLNDLLFEEGLALLNAGGSDIQGLFGAVSTSTHGSGIHIGPYPNFIRSMVLLSAGGKAYRIEPTDGISIRAEYEQTEEFTKHGIELIQDDKWFNSALVNMGCFGIAYSAIIEVREKYELYEERKLGFWEDERDKIVAKGIEYLEKHRHFELAINPYPVNEAGEIDPGGKHVCLVTTRDYVNANTPPPNAQTSKRNFLSSVLTGISFAGSISAWMFNRKPEGIPKNINNSMLRIVDYKTDGGGYRDWAYKVLNQGLKEIKFHGYATEIGFSIEDFPTAVDRILSMALDAAQNYKQYHPAPFSCRFVASSPAYLSMMHDQPSAMIEVVSMKGVIGGSDVQARVEKEMIKMGGRPHWGLNVGNLQAHGDELKERYPKLDQWRDVYDSLGASQTFGNKFSKRMGFDS